MDQITVEPIKPEVIEGSLETALAEAKGDIVIKKITNQGELEATVAFVKRLDKFIKTMEETRLSITRPIDEAKERVMEIFRPRKEKATEIRKAAAKEVDSYMAEQEKKRLEEQARLEREAKAKEAADKAKLEARADKAEAKGDGDKAEALREQAGNVAVVPAIAPKRFEAPKGAVPVEYYAYEVVDEKLVPREFLIINDKALQAFANATKSKGTVPGIKFTSEKRTTFRGK